MRTIIFLFTTLVFNQLINAQIYTTNNGHIWFYSHTPIEDIEAHNYQVVSTINAASGDIVFTLSVQSFEFRIALMQEHFNDNYMESDKYPDAVFRGKIINPQSVVYNKNGIYTVTVMGDLTVHGVTRQVKAAGTIEIKGKSLVAKAKFVVNPADFNIAIPEIMQIRIAREIEVNVDVTCNQV